VHLRHAIVDQIDDDEMFAAAQSEALEIGSILTHFESRAQLRCRSRERVTAAIECVARARYHRANGGAHGTPTPIPEFPGDSGCVAPRERLGVHR
jgi:hypothetical protein